MLRKHRQREGSGKLREGFREAYREGKIRFGGKRCPRGFHDKECGKIGKRCPDIFRGPARPAPPPKELYSPKNMSLFPGRFREGSGKHFEGTMAQTGQRVFSGGWPPSSWGSRGERDKGKGLYIALFPFRIYTTPDCQK